MADDPNPTLSAQLLAARAVLAPQIRGMGDFENTSISVELKSKLEEVKSARVHRDVLLAAALSARDTYIVALSNLEADGYPALPNVQVANSLLSEIKEEQDDLSAAIQVFVAEQAASMSIGLGAPVAKTA
jgi:hypothetical protein